MSKANNPKPPAFCVILLGGEDEIPRQLKRVYPVHAAKPEDAAVKFIEMEDDGTVDPDIERILVIDKNFHSYMFAPKPPKNEWTVTLV